MRSCCRSAHRRRSRSPAPHPAARRRPPLRRHPRRTRPPPSPRARRRRRTRTLSRSPCRLGSYTVPPATARPPARQAERHRKEQERSAAAGAATRITPTLDVALTRQGHRPQRRVATLVAHEGEAVDAATRPAGLTDAAAGVVDARRRAATERADHAVAAGALALARQATPAGHAALARRRVAVGVELAGAGHALAGPAAAAAVARR